MSNTHDKAIAVLKCLACERDDEARGWERTAARRQTLGYAAEQAAKHRKIAAELRKSAETLEAAQTWQAIVDERDGEHGG